MSLSLSKIFSLGKVLKDSLSFQIQVVPSLLVTTLVSQLI